MIEDLREQAMLRAKNGGHQNQEDQCIEIAEEFRGIINNALYSINGNRCLLNALSTQINQHN